ncbi:MAG: hypothetical protein DRJ03_18665 [Chloroflexi bacterium]|nr:MAG: hypothetical protein DRJ03_18665 [Chloroflexota bacterium]
MTETDKQQPLSDLRNKIIMALDYLEPEHEWITTEMVVKFIEMKFAEIYTLSKVGNNLRVLREHRVVVDRLRRGVRQWQKTGISYSPEPYKKLLISFPQSLHEKLLKYAKKGGMSKNAFVVNMVTTGIKNLHPLHNSFREIEPEVTDPSEETS